MGRPVPAAGHLRPDGDGGFAWKWAAVGGAPLPALAGAVILLAVALRLVAALILEQSADSGDPLAYFTMARTLAEQGVIADNFGQHAFFSAGYPIILAPFFLIFGSSLAVVLTVNLILAATTGWLVFRLARVLSGRDDAALLAALAYALWFPGIWNATMVAKENLSTPLLIALALCAVQIARNRRPALNGLVAGLLWAAALITGGSALPLCAGAAIATVILWRCTRSLKPALLVSALFLVGAAAGLSPWLYATDQMVGRPVLTTNAAFNFYLGHNPAATGRFVSIADTPVGKDWEQTRLRLGEVGTAELLEGQAIAWVAGHPGAAVELAARKLIYFWQPNVPDAADFESSRTLAMVRWVEVGQYVLILALAGWAFWGSALGSRDKWILATMIVGFWLLHALAYVIIRYRDPAMPLLIVVASVQVADWARRRRGWGGASRAA